MVTSTGLAPAIRMPVM